MGNVTKRFTNWIGSYDVLPYFLTLNPYDNPTELFEALPATIEDLAAPEFITGAFRNEDLTKERANRIDDEIRQLRADAAPFDELSDGILIALIQSLRT